MCSSAKNTELVKENECKLGGCWQSIRKDGIQNFNMCSLFQYFRLGRQSTIRQIYANVIAKVCAKGHALRFSKLRRRYLINSGDFL
jgi:hypothetical protein